MIANRNSRERALALAALKLAGQTAWDNLTLAQIAKAARCPLLQARKLFPDTTALLPAVVRLIDEETAVLVGTLDNSAAARDRLFEVLMARFDVLQSHRAGVLAIAAACRATPSRIPVMLKTQWDSMRAMLRLANLSECGIFQTVGLIALYDLALRRWSDDHTSDMAKTMATLDRLLRRAERLIEIFARASSDDHPRQRGHTRV